MSKTRMAFAAISTGIICVGAALLPGATANAAQPTPKCSMSSPNGMQESRIDHHDAILATYRLTCDRPALLNVSLTITSSTGRVWHDGGADFPFNFVRVAQDQWVLDNNGARHKINGSFKGNVDYVLSGSATLGNGTTITMPTVRQKH